MGSVDKLNSVDNVKHEIDIVLNETEMIEQAIKEIQDNYGD